MSDRKKTRDRSPVCAVIKPDGQRTEYTNGGIGRTFEKAVN